MLSQLDGVDVLASIYQINSSLDERVAESKSSSSELVVHVRIYLRTIIEVVALRKRSNAKGIYEALPNNDRKPLVVDNVLNLSHDDTPGLLVQLFIRPVGMNASEDVGHSVVFAMEKDVDGGETRLFVHSGVTCMEAKTSTLSRFAVAFARSVQRKQVILTDLQETTSTGS